jgi:aminoglycoside phosphotransferase (APT) family kinase protein
MAPAAQSADIERTLAALGLRPVAPPQPLSGGVSCDVYRVDLEEGPVCVKRALAQLRVAAEWRAPVERSGNEVRWLQTAAGIPGVNAPKVLAESREANLFVMSWFEPALHPVWKDELAQGRVDLAFAGEVGRALGTIHAATARDPEIGHSFQSDELFCKLRLEPYFLDSATRHPDLAAALEHLSSATLATHKALVHGDVSPKNILCGPEGPVFLDAECAWWGDPAFDLAFCLNHLLLKCVWRPQHAALYLRAFDRLRDTYMAVVDWEDRSVLDARAAGLLAALLLARVDGKSPVEYLTRHIDRNFVRAMARAFIRKPPGSLAELKRVWSEGIVHP